MDHICWEAQVAMNELTNAQLKLMLKQINTLIEIVEDHEKDMLKMVDVINELQKKVSELEGRP